jgi:CDP-diacylglycerol--serine O-phosphatidyltransferase
MAKNRRFRRGIYLLPTVFTVGNLFCGFASIMQAGAGNFGWAALLILIAGVLDGLDGRIARLTNTTSEFGIEFDSLADIVSFGVAPAFLAHAWALVPLDKLGWLVAFVYVVCVAMRLARFNIQRHAEDKRHFAGLPSPAAAGSVACLVYAVPEPVTLRWASGLAALFLVTVATLSISHVRYRSFKEFDLRNRRSYLYVFPMAVVLVAVVTLPEVALPTFAAAYLLSGPLAYGWTVAVRRRRARDRQEVAERAPVSRDAL